MGSLDVAVIDLATLTQSGWIRGVGNSPRHVVMDPAGAFLYVTLNGEGTVGKVDLATGTVVARTSTGAQPRSMAISADGRSLYVVNYGSSTVTKLATQDMSILQQVSGVDHPIGIAYDAATHRVWVASYTGAIMIYDDA
ncbi:MAG: YncE family protein [Actinobacteria bacterium]|nr:MAG: YncE family protein [Actinomycetota bacterium]